MDDIWAWIEKALTDQQEEIFGTLLVAALLGALAMFRGKFKRKPVDEPARAPRTQTLKIEVEQKPTPTEAVAPSEGRPVTLGRPNPDFTGRVAKISEVIAALNSGRRASIVGVAGMGGIGKTALAELVGHRLLGEGRFPDGAVKVDLHGFSGAARSPRDALLLLLSAVGQPMGAPQTDDEATAVALLSDAWIKATTGKDMLVLLDNAGSAAQIEHLMPGQGATVLVTSRRNLTLTGGAEVDLDVMSDADADDLIAALAPELTDDDAARLRAVADGLPLMIEVVAQAIRKSTRPAAAVLAEYEALTADDYDERVRQRLGFSVDQLGAEDAAAWAALSQFEGGVFTHFAAIMWGIEPEEAARWFDRFHDRRLVIPVETPLNEALGGRWRLHDHLRDIAAARLAADPLADAARDGWLTSAETMMEVAGGLYSSHGDGIMTGLALLDMELATIRRAQADAGARAAEDDIAARVAMRLPNYGILDLRLSPAERLHWLEAGLPGARRLGDKAQEAILTGNAGHRRYVQGDLVGAEEMYRKSLALEEEMGRKEGMASDYGNLGLLLRARGDLVGAEEMYRKSLVLNEEMGRKVGMASNYGNLGNLLSDRGDLDGAEEMYRQSTALNEEMGRKEGMANQYGNLGALLRARGNLDGAEAMYRESLALNEEMGRKEGMANAYGNLGNLLRDRGDLEGAEEMYRKSLALEEEMGRKEGMASDYGNLGLLLRDRSDLDGAEDMYRNSLALNEEMGRKEGMAIQSHNLADLRLAQSRLEEALELAERALALFTEMGAAPNVAKSETLIADIRAAMSGET